MSETKTPKLSKVQRAQRREETLRLGGVTYIDDGIDEQNADWYYELATENALRRRPARTTMSNTKKDPRRTRCSVTRKPSEMDTEAHKANENEQANESTKVHTAQSNENTPTREHAGTTMREQAGAVKLA